MSKKFRVHFTNHGYSPPAQAFASLAEAVAYVRACHCDAGIYEGDTLRGSWSVFGGFRSYGTGSP